MAGAAAPWLRRTRARGAGRSSPAAHAATLAAALVALSAAGLGLATVPSAPALATSPRRAAAPSDPVRDATRELREAEQARAAGQTAQRLAGERLRAAQAEARRLAEARVAAATRLRDADLQVEEATARVEALSQRRREIDARVADRAAALAPMLPLAVRLSLFPAETLLAAPAPPEASLRGLLVLRGLAHQTAAEAAALRADAEAARRLAVSVEAEMRHLRAAQAEQANRAAELDRQLAASRDVARQAEDAGTDAARRVAVQAARAESLRGVLTRLEAERDRQEAAARRQREAEQREAVRTERQAPQPPPPPVLAPAAAQAPPQASDPARAAFASPVAGTVLRGWGEHTDAGPSNGLSYRAPPGARVVSPCGGRVVFAGPFRSFGPMVILDCGGGYHMVLAGLERLDAQVGHPVQAGEPVGVMAAWDPRAGAAPPLYVELRRGGEPINPAPFLRARG